MKETKNRDILSSSSLRDVFKMKIEDKKKAAAEFKSVKEIYNAKKEESDVIVKYFKLLYLKCIV